MRSPIPLPANDSVQDTSAGLESTTAPRGRRLPSAKAARPRGGVPGGKALARRRFFHLQRCGVATEGVGTLESVVSQAAAPLESALADGTVSRSSAAASPAENLLEGFRLAQASERALDEPAAAAAGLEAAARPTPQTWQPLGPFYMPHGQTYGEGPGSRPSVSGRISAIAIDPSNANHILCGSAGGGVWETRDAGRTWSPRTDSQPSLAIGALAFDPLNPLRAYAGTGEGNSDGAGRDNVRAAGLLTSADGGATWSMMPGATFVGASFFDLLVDRSNSNHLLAATTDGLYQSTSGGASWTKRQSALTWSVSKHPVVSTNPASGREVLAATAAGLVRSTNSGTSWSAVTLPGVPANHFLVRMAVAHSPSNGSVAYVFASFQKRNDDEAEPVARLWRRSTFGGAFTAVAPPADLEAGQSWYDWFLGVAPNNPDLIYLGAINMHRGNRQANGVWKWLTVSAKKPLGDSIHPDQHAIAFSPADPNVVYVGNDGGVYRSPNAGVHWESLNKGLCITEIEFLTQHPEHDAWILAGTQDNGTIRYEGQQTWYQVQDGDGGDCGIDDTSPATCYHSFYGPYLERSNAGGAWNTWDSAASTAMANEGSLFYPPLEVNGAVVVRGATRIWISRNRGGSWKNVALPGLTGKPSALAAPAANRIFAGTSNGEMYRLDLTGATWSVTPLTSPKPGGYVSDLICDADLWATVNENGFGRVYRSSDNGATWTELGAGIPPTVALHAIEIDRANPARLFVGSDVGVYETKDGGATWTRLARGLPNVLVKDILLHPKSRLLRIGTQARGVWELSLEPADMPDVAVYVRDHAADTGRVLPSLDNVPNPFQPGTNVFWWQSPDIKVDSSPFLTTAVDDLDFALYSDDRSKVDGGIEFASGLLDERPVRGQTVRVYVQVHNRGSKPATNVAVRVFVASTSLVWPDLPADFFANFPQNSVPADSPWQPIAAHRVIASIDPGRSAVVGFAWPVALAATPSAGLLAVISAENDELAESERVISKLVRQSRYCALRHLAIVNPPAVAGPAAPGMTVRLGAAAERQSLRLDEGGLSLVRGVVLDKTLAASAEKAGWQPLKLTAADQEYLAQLTDREPGLKKMLSPVSAWRPVGKSCELPLGDRATRAERTLVVLFNLKSKSREGSALILGGDDQSRGGVTFVNLAGQR